MSIAPTNTKFLLHFDGNATDEANFLHSPTVTGRFVSGHFGQALDCASTGGVSFPAGFIPSPLIFCLESWIKLNSTGTSPNYQIYEQNIGNLSITVNSNLGLTFRPDGGTGGSVSNNNFFLRDDLFHHYAISRDVNGLMLLFRDGVIFQNNITNTRPFNTSPVTDAEIGSRPVSLGTTYPLNGVIDEFLWVDGDAYRTANFTPPAEAYTYPPKSISIGGTTITKGTTLVVSSDNSVIESIPSIAADPYYVAPANWKQINYIYGMVGYSGLKNIIINNNGSNVFSESLTPFSYRAKSGVWNCRAIIINDYEGDFYEVVGSEIPAGLDVTVS